MGSAFPYFHCLASALFVGGSFGSCDLFYTFIVYFIMVVMVVYLTSHSGVGIGMRHIILTLGVRHATPICTIPNTPASCVRCLFPPDQSLLYSP